MLHDLVKQQRALEEEDFYQLFALPRYAKMNNANVEALDKSFRRLVLQYHPDKNPIDSYEVCNAWTVKICLAREVLMTPDLKRRYDKELRQQYNEGKRWGTIAFWLSWGLCVAAMAGGLAALVVSCSPLGILAGNALLHAGVKGSFKLWQDPNCSATELSKELAVGAAQGLACGSISLPFRAAAHGASLTFKVMAGGAAHALAAPVEQAISDATDISIAKGLLGKHMEDYANSGRTVSEVFSRQNAKKCAVHAAIGGLLGAGFVALGGAFNAVQAWRGQGIANVNNGAIVGGSTSKVVLTKGTQQAMSNAIDDGNAAGTSDVTTTIDGTADTGSESKTLFTKGTQVTGSALDATHVSCTQITTASKVALKKGVQNSVDDAFSPTTPGETSHVASKFVAHGVEDTIDVVEDVFGAVVFDEVEEIFERIRQAHPNAVDRLVDDASKAHFMLSRTNIKSQKAFADQKLMHLVEEGFALCTDNSLKEGWGGPGWTSKFAEDAKKTRFGVLVLENGQEFFDSKPCVDELEAAKKAGVNLTKFYGTSIRSGHYLWIEITDEIFETHGHYEEMMRKRHDGQYTPIWFEATRGPHYKKELEGTCYTYYCLVPQGANAHATGADRQCW